MSMEHPSSADAVVVGGGIMGTASAYFLTTETDLSVCLLEKDSIAAGSTGDSSAILRHHYGANEPYTRMALWSHEFYRALEEQIDEPLSHTENPMVRFAAEGTPAASFAESGFNLLSELNIPVTWVESEEFKDRYPLLDIDEFDFGVSDDSAGYSDGNDAAAGFARAAQREGATVVTGVEVTEIVVQDRGGDEEYCGRVAGVETDVGTVNCENVIIAAGPWSGPLADTVGLNVPITPEREHVLLLEPSGDLSFEDDELPTISISGADWYLRPDFADGVLIATHHTGDVCNPDTYEDSADESVILRLADQLSEVVPALADAKIKGDYCGVYATTPDNDFIIDQAGPDGCYLACGFSGHGFKHGPAVGRILTDIVTNCDTDFVDIDMFSLSRFDENPSGNRKTVEKSECGEE